MSDGLIFMLMVFAAAFLLSQGMIVPVFGERRQARKRLQRRLANLSDSSGKPNVHTLMREKYLQDLRPFERRLESLRLNEWLSRVIEQSGHKILAYRLVLLSIALAVIGGVVGWVSTRNPLMTSVMAVVAGYLPFLKIFRDRTKQLAKFDEQLPDAIDIMRRAMQAGHPFNETLNLVAFVVDPFSLEIEQLRHGDNVTLHAVNLLDANQPAIPILLAFNLQHDINYGNDVRRAMLGLLRRV